MTDKNKTWLCDNCLSYNIQIADIKDSELDVYCLDCNEHHYKVSEWFNNLNKKTIMEVA